MPPPIHILAATGRTGITLARTLIAAGRPIVPVVRDLDKWHRFGLPGEARQADLMDLALLRIALRDASRIVSCAHARHAKAIIASAPPEAQLVLLGSTRKFTRWPDDHGNGVLDGEAALLASGRRGVMLHPTMIYGATGENNVQRLAALLRRLPFLPLPGGGKALVQPIHQDDVTRCIVAALDRDWDGPSTLIVAGGSAQPYTDFVRAIARAAGLPPPRILPFPAAPLIAAAGLTRFLPLLPTVEPAEIRRLLEDKAFETLPMRQTLGINPITLDEGLARTFATPQKT
jgi:nucleoside-diphosphate-sugar epimerase